MNDDDEELLRLLRELESKMEDLNSLYPATREFLKKNGVTHIKELSLEKREELTAYLIAKNAALIGDKKPSN